MISVPRNKPCGAWDDCFSAVAGFSVFRRVTECRMSCLGVFLKRGTAKISLTESLNSMKNPFLVFLSRSIA